MGNGIVIRGSKNVKVIGNYIDVDGDPLVITDSKNIEALHNIILSIPRLSARNIEDLKIIVDGMHDLTDETKLEAKMILELLENKDKQTTASGLKRVLNLVGSVGFELLVEYLKKIMGL